MKRLALLLLAIVVTACASSAPDMDPQPPERSDPRGGYERPSMWRGGGSSLELLPPDRWWKDEKIAAALKLTAEQTADLERIITAHRDEIVRLQDSVPGATKELREVLQREKVTPEEIVSASQRLRTLRDGIFGEQLRMLAEERAILTLEQWNALAERVKKERPDMRDHQRGLPGGSAGGGGAWPG